MDINYLMTFADVIKLKSISKTSRKQFISQPGVSLRIKKLERELGISLFEYRDKHIYPTEAGKRLFRFADNIYHDYQSLLNDLEYSKEELTGDLKISTSLICGEFILPSILSNFSKRYQSVGIRIVTSDSEKVISNLKSGIFEIGFGGRAPNSDDNELVSFKFAEEEMVLIVPLGHKLAQQDEASLEELVGETFIVREDPWEVQRSWSQILSKAGFDIGQFKSKFVTGTNMGVISAVQSGAGIAFISDTAVKLNEALGLIKVLKFKGLILKRNFFCIHRKTSTNNRIVNEFIKYMHELVKIHPSP